MVERIAHPLPLQDVQITGGFWGNIAKTVREKMLPYQWKVLNDQAEDAEPSHCIRNFKIAGGLEEGEFGGMVFQDSDLAKWLEAVAYALSTHPDEELERWADEAVDYVEKAQQPDGYLDTYFIIKEPTKRWTDLRDCHELYCAGHMMEAAVAYYQATGKRKLLDIMLRNAKHIISVLGPEEGKLRGYPGHEEIELALVRMYQVTGDKELLKQAKYFIDERGQDPKFFIEEARKREADSHFPANSALGMSYFQSHLPVREQKTIEGHSVRALYLLSGMIDVAVATGDEELLKACYTLYDNATTKRMYVTGGVGSTHIGEAFTFDYDLPNDMVYAETCASIALVFVAQRLLNIRPDGAIADVMETALYNTCLAGMALDAKHFFYVNPLEVVPETCHKNPDHHHVLPVRPAWYGCACCPPNLARLVCSLGAYAYSAREDGLYIHMFMDGGATFDVAGNRGTVKVETAYPFDGRVVVKPEGGAYNLHLHLPAWCRKYMLAVNGSTTDAEVRDGYLVVRGDWKQGDSIELMLDLEPRRLYAHTRVASDTGCVAIARGPIVYCAEQADNGDGLYQIRLPRESQLRTEPVTDEVLGEIVRVAADAYTTVRHADDSPLYTEAPPVYDQPIELKLIPYYTWANRGEGEMRVWIHEL